jgi:hypothetical protein
MFLFRCLADAERRKGAAVPAWWRQMIAAAFNGLLMLLVFVPSLALAERVTNGQQVLYTFEEGSGTTVRDISGVGTPLNLTIENAATTTWTPGGLAITGTTLIASAGAATKVIDAVQASNALTIEAWLIPANTTQKGPARIVSLSQDPYLRNFTLGQNRASYDMRLRTAATDSNGRPSLRTADGSLVNTLTHVVYTRDTSGLAKLYLDGVEQAGTTVAGAISNWDPDQRLALANELTGDRPWLGELQLVAIYDRAITAAEIEQNYLAGPNPAQGSGTLILPGFDPISDALWDETAVRKVLHTFAYGGQATDSQITQWANLRPDQAIVQMLTFDQHNVLLSPVDADSSERLDTRDGTLQGLAQFWASNDPENRIYTPSRVRYDMLGLGGQTDIVWTRAATSRGLNPFRQKVGLWETNYHMATNQSVVPRRAMMRYYDVIMGALEANRPYREVMAEAAKSAAVAIQYGHRKNVFVDGECRCNEDFAREFHQLFFGVLGSAEPEYHETVSIKNTAAALTDMSVGLDPLPFGGLDNQVVFGTEFHTPGVLEVHHAGIGGSDAAQRIDELTRLNIEHPESLDNLPVKIIRGLADENLTDVKIGQIRLAWQSMAEKSLLVFLRAYAISDLFHDASRVKYRTSIDRHLLILNRITLNNEEGYLDLYNPIFGYQNEDVRAFYPAHNVFGGQTGEEASRSTDIFRNNFDQVTANAQIFIQASGSKYGRTWEKDWARVIPRSATGYMVQEVAEWLWQRFVADGLRHLGPLERAHLYALLGAGVDLAYLLDPNAADRVITSAEVQTDSFISATVSELAQRVIALDSADTSQRVLANQRIGQAINFIVGTPFMFVDEGG